MHTMNGVASQALQHKIVAYVSSEGSEKDQQHSLQHIVRRVREGFSSITDLVTKVLK